MPNPLSQQLSSTWDSSSQPRCTPVDLCLSLGYVQLLNWFCGFHSFKTLTDQLLHPPSTASNTSLLFQLISLDVGVCLPLQFSHPHCSSSPDFALFLYLPSFFCHIQSCVNPHNSFCWLRTPASILPMICENCVFVDVFPVHLWTEMHALDIHLLLCHLGSPQSFPLNQLHSVFVR